MRWRPLCFLSQLQAAAQTVGIMKAVLLLFIVSVMTAAVARTGLHIAQWGLGSKEIKRNTSLALVDYTNII